MAKNATMTAAAVRDMVKDHRSSGERFKNVVLRGDAEGAAAEKHLPHSKRGFNARAETLQ
jgi:hypothetical protein